MKWPWVHQYSYLIKEDPEIALSYYRALAYFFGFENHEFDEEKATDELTRAITIDPYLSYAYYFKARFQERNRELRMDAIRNLDEAIRINPDFPHAYFRRGLLSIGNLYCPWNANSDNSENLREENMKDIVSDFTNSLVLQPDMIESYYYRSLIYSKYGEEHKTISDLESVIQNYSGIQTLYGTLNLFKEGEETLGYIESLTSLPENANDYFSRGLIRFRLQDWQGAFSDFSKAIQLNPNFAEAYYQRAMISIYPGEDCQRNYTSTLDDFSQAIKFKEDFSAAYFYRGYIQFYRANPYPNTIDFTEEDELLRKGAVEDFTKSLEINPNNAIIHFFRANAFHFLYDDDFSSLEQAKAIHDFIQMIRVDPKLFDYSDFRFNFEDPIQGDKHDKVSTLAQEIIDNKALPSHYFHRGLAYLELGKFEEAISDLTDAIDLNSNDADSYYTRGLSHYRNGQYLQAINDLTEAFTLNPYLPEALVLRGLIKYDLGNFQGSVEDTSLAIRLAPQQATAYFVRSIALRSLGEEMLSQTNYYYGIDFSPWIIRFSRGYSSVRSVSAIIYYERAVSLERRGDQSGAIHNFERAAELFRSTGDLVRHQESVERARDLQENLNR
jgi:tetratricopeptide (TPR) repeat protein